MKFKNLVLTNLKNNKNAKQCEMMPLTSNSGNVNDCEMTKLKTGNKTIE